MLEIMRGFRGGIGIIVVAAAALNCSAQEQPVFSFPGVQPQSAYADALRELIVSKLPEETSLVEGESNWEQFASWVARLSGAIEALPYGDERVQEWLASEPGMAPERAWFAGAEPGGAEGLAVDVSDDLVRALHATGLLEYGEWLVSAEGFVPSLASDIRYSFPEWLRYARSVAITMRGVLWSDARRADWDQVEQDLAVVLAIARVSSSWADPLGPLLAVSTEHVAVGSVHALLVHFEPPREQLVSYLRLMLNHPSADIVYGLEAGQIVTRARLDGRLERYQGVPESEVRERRRAAIRGLAPRDAQMNEIGAFFEHWIMLCQDDADARAQAESWFDAFEQRRSAENRYPSYDMVDELLPSYFRYVSSTRLAAARKQGLIALLALELFRTDHGAYPDSLGELVPDYLGSIPRDPFAPGEGLRYRRVEADARRPWPFIVYSVGADGSDNQGRFDAECPRRASWFSARDEDLDLILNFFPIIAECSP